MDGPACLPPSPCLPWVEGNPCPCACNHECSEPPVADVSICLPSKPSVGYSEYVKKPQPFSLLRFSGSDLNCKCSYWHENRLTAHYRYTCTDHKYYVPSSKGPVPLVFSVSASACWRDQDACKGMKICECPADAESCKDCDNRGCCEPCHH